MATPPPACPVPAPPLLSNEELIDIITQIQYTYQVQGKRGLTGVYLLPTGTVKLGI